MVIVCTHDWLIFLKSIRLLLDAVRVTKNFSEDDFHQPEPICQNQNVQPERLEIG